MSRKPRLSRPTGLLASAHPSEIDWDETSFMLRNQKAGDAPFVYFISEGDGGPIKIGQAVDPIKRLRALQTGNPRRLRIERLIFGDRDVEGLLHEYFLEFVVPSSKHRSSDINPRYAVETEWFQPSARERILDAATEISWRQITAGKSATYEDMRSIVGDVMAELGYEIKRADAVVLLGRDAGNVERKRRL